MGTTKMSFLIFVILSSFSVLTICAKGCPQSTLDYRQFLNHIATGQTFNHIYSVENFPDAYGKGYSMYTPVNETMIQAFIYTYVINSTTCEQFTNSKLDVKRRSTKYRIGNRRYRDDFITMEADGVEFRYFSQAPDKYFWFMGCANGTTQSWDGCSLRFIDLLIPDNRPGQTEKINLSGLPWHLIATDLKKITGMTFDDPSMKYIWQGPGCTPSDITEN